MASIHPRTITWTTKAGEKRAAQRYQARYVDRAGKEHARLFKLKRDAQRWLDEQAAALVTGTWADPAAGKQFLSTYADGWIARQVVSRNTNNTYQSVLDNHIKNEIGGMRIDSIRAADVQALVKKWSQTAAASTVEFRYLVLAMILRSAVRERVIPVSPCVKIKLPRGKAKAALVPITTAAVEALAAAMPPHLRALVIVGAGTGMRRGELIGLTLDRVSTETDTIRVDRQLDRLATGDKAVFVPPKTEASVRTIPVAEVVLDAIRTHVEEFGVHESGLIFTSQIGSPLRTSTLWTAWSKAAARAGVDATPHDLRHYFASIQIAGGTSIKALQALLGHKSAVETWDTYGHLMGDEDDRSREVIERALGKAPEKSSDGSRTVTVKKIRLRRSAA